MPRNRGGLFDALVTAPWPFGIAFGVVGFLFVRYGISAFISSTESPYLASIGKALNGGALAPVAWMVLGLGLIAALLSALMARRRRQLLESRSGLASLQELSWREFEHLVSEVFRRRGYHVKETGGGGADGGVDLLLRKDAKLELVQCKRWKQRQVSVMTVRELFGLLLHHGAQKAWIVCCGDFTRDAQAFAEGKAIELVSGQALVEAIESVKQLSPKALTDSPQPNNAQSPTCPTCSGEMVIRTNRRNGQTFWGCATYPTCRGARGTPL